MKNLVIGYVSELLVAAKERKTSQGVKIYELVLDQLRTSNSDADVLEILSRLKAALMGMETHGFFPPIEYDIVKKIFLLKGGFN